MRGVCVRKQGDERSNCDLPKLTVDSGPGHEPRNRRLRDKLYNPSQPQKPNPEYDKPSDKRQRRSNHLRFPILIRMMLLDILNDVGRLEGHDSDGSDGDVFRGGEEGVGEYSDEG